MRWDDPEPYVHPLAPRQPMTRWQIAVIVVTVALLVLGLYL